MRNMVLLFLLLGALIVASSLYATGMVLVNMFI